jgi:hypothetical protein
MIPILPYRNADSASLEFTHFTIYETQLAVSLPMVSRIGLLLDVAWLALSTLLIASDTVRLIRWRRDYEASLARLMRGQQ